MIWSISFLKQKTRVIHKVVVQKHHNSDIELKR